MLAFHETETCEGIIQHLEQRQCAWRSDVQIRDRGSETSADARVEMTFRLGDQLYAIWDTCLVQYAVGPDASEAATDLLAVITPEMKVEWTASMPRDWANESFAIAEAARTRYCINRGTSCDPAARNLAIGAEYLDANEPVVKEQLRRPVSVWPDFSIRPCRTNHAGQHPTIRLRRLPPGPGCRHECMVGLGGPCLR